MEELAKMQAEVRALRMENAQLKRENEALTLNATRLRTQLVDHVPLQHDRVAPEPEFVTALDAPSRNRH